jgi:hypothetical protein
MRYFLFLILVLGFGSGKIHFKDVLNRQNNRCDINTGIKDSTVLTPAGPALKSKVHYIDRNHHLSIDHNYLKIIDNKTGHVSKQYANTSAVTESKKNRMQSSENQMLLTESDFKDGWTNYAVSRTTASTGSIKFFGTDWIVPQCPKNKYDQVIFIFSGLETFVRKVGYILQPVLQWGKSSAGGGNFWAVCNWYVTSNEFFHDSLIKVDPGTKLNGVMKLLSQTDTLFTYSSSFSGLSDEFVVKNSPELSSLYEALETYYVQGCDEYPAQEKITMSDIEVNTHKDNPPLVWDVINETGSCGQLARTVNKGSGFADVEIRFHNVHSFENIDSLRVYPNPVGDALSISSLKHITGCKIEIYNLNGSLLQSISNISIDFIYGNKYAFYYELNMQNYSHGFYLVKISYDNKAHTFKIFKL